MKPPLRLNCISIVGSTLFHLVHLQSCHLPFIYCYMCGRIILLNTNLKIALYFKGCSLLCIWNPNFLNDTQGSQDLAELPSLLSSHSLVFPNVSAIHKFTQNFTYAILSLIDQVCAIGLSFLFKHWTLPVATNPVLAFTSLV